MGRHKCPACGRPHEEMKEVDTKARARKAALVRWGKGEVGPKLVRKREVVEEELAPREWVEKDD